MEAGKVEFINSCCKEVLPIVLHFSACSSVHSLKFHRVYLTFEIFLVLATTVRLRFLSFDMVKILNAIFHIETSLISHGKCQCP